MKVYLAGKVDKAGTRDEPSCGSKWDVIEPLAEYHQFVAVDGGEDFQPEHCGGSSYKEAWLEVSLDPGNTNPEPAFASEKAVESTGRLRCTGRLPGHA